MGDKYEITRQRIQSVWRHLGGKGETSAKLCGAEHSEHPECTLGDKWETSAIQVGAKPEIMHSNNPGSVAEEDNCKIMGDNGDKCEIMRSGNQN